VKCGFYLWACLLASMSAGAHSASDAYLTLSVDTGQAHSPVVHGQWDIALRDLDFVLSVDDDGDGQVTWGELKHHQAAIAQYAYRQLDFSDGAKNPCSIKAGRQMIDAHADGAYAVLFFDVVCARPPKSLIMEYRLFFAIDPSHRGIFVMHSGSDASTAVLSPEHAHIVLPIVQP
jgi:hypothetical protein